MRRRDQIIYAAGLIDGEGCVGLNRIRGEVARNGSLQYRPRLRVKMIDYPPLALLEGLFGGSIRLHPYPDPYHDQWEWSLISWGPVSKALRELLPWLLVKPRQARLLLRLATEIKHQPRRRPLTPEYLNQRHRYYCWMRALNARGTLAPDNQTVYDEFGEVRAQIDAGGRPVTVGELTYVLTGVVLEYVQAKGGKFQTFADILAALDATGKEFYRRQIAPYEDQKIVENGDVYS